VKCIEELAESGSVRQGRSRRRGSTQLEFVLVGIPMIFILISIFEVARGMWTFHTLAYAVREGVRYASMHGKGCASPNSCQVTIGGITTVIKNAGVGLDANTITLTFTPAAGSPSSATMASQLTNATIWPPSNANTPGQIVKISALYQFRSLLALFWPGAGRPVTGRGIFYLPASSSEAISF
jgi:TadE-like protein